jgi:peptidoglycan/LPS O-acetylase OafA/YrhL
VCGGEARWSPLRLLQWAPLRGIGRISYGLYLYHLPIYGVVLFPAPSLGRAAAAIAISLVVAGISYLAVERPILRYGGRFRGRAAGPVG